jgi:hypothetical protein
MEPQKRALDKVFRRRDRYEIPEWQRDDVWSVDKKQLLIDSLLRGWKLPKFYLARTSSGAEQYEVVDGQQRLLAIFEFYNGSLHLSADTAAEFSGDTYDHLPDTATDRLDDYEIEFDVITDADESQLREFFLRLQGGLPLTSAERLNAVKSKLTNAVRSLAKYRFFTEKVWIANTRKAHFDVVAKVAAIEVDGIDTGQRFDDLKATFEAQSNFAMTSNVGKRLKATFEMLDEIFPVKDPSLRNRSTVQSYATLCAAVIATGKGAGSAPRLSRFFAEFAKNLAHQVELGRAATDTDYELFQSTLSANVKAGARTRHEILIRKLFAFDPQIAGLFGPPALAASGLGPEIGRIASRVGDLIATLNERYSSENAGDLFKATNKTAPALVNIGKPLADFEQYKAFVGDLYYLFKEGVGQRLTAGVPRSFQDVNLLRTGLEHDLDHGKAADVTKKKKRVADVFRSYSGESTPTALAPERFVVVQANLLRALEADLRNLRW